MALRSAGAHGRGDRDAGDDLVAEHPARRAPHRDRDGALSHDRIVHDLPAFFAVSRDAPFTVQYNLTGQPATSAPLHMLDGLPIGTQIAGRPGGEETLLSLAAALESARPWRDTRPPVSATLSGASA
ncbi:amidase family protein [Sphingosinicella microcystinivorans]|uniref:amidase family protein n=1 Tax=Sphingosinicella microcystinivorans TaxID=335406 RepID=UPI0022F3AF57|nr:amidase family protein [Sphingosinicella microcystinivorans]WBX85330.1 amidase family protein [Sphingosinicella microcystinivorans]